MDFSFSLARCRRGAASQAGHGGARILIVPIGELHASFVFPSALSAKTAWEKVSKRCKNLSVNRWSPDGTPAGGVMVTVITEESDRREFEKACVILGRKGRRIEAPPAQLEAQLNKRVRMYAATGGRRVLKRTPGGTVVTPDGIDHGPLRRPQG